MFDKAGNRIFTEDLYIDFSEAITEIISEMRLPEPLQHGGYCHPGISHTHISTHVHI